MRARYRTPPATNHPAKRLVMNGGQRDDSSFTFFDQVEIGRYREGREAPGKLLVDDPTVSSHHCIITQEPDGRCYVRDMSRNGTRLNGRRLSPNLKTELEVGHVLSVGRELSFRLEGELPAEVPMGPESAPGTMGVSDLITVTVLVGDIRDYTVLVQQADTSALQESVGRVFERLEKEVVRLGGTLKEFQGDALFAFWEAHSTANHANDACRAAIALHSLVGELAEDRSVWQVEGFPLCMDWALATGPVMISGHGSNGALGLSMVGETVVLAFRIEKFANDSTGPIIACPITRQMASRSFKFKGLGSRKAKGFSSAHKLYSLVRERR